MSPVQRAALSHRLRSAVESNGKPPKIYSEDLEPSSLAKLSLPSPAIQATNVIRYIGDVVSSTGQSIPTLPAFFHAMVGSPNRDFAFAIVAELEQRGLLTGTKVVTWDANEFLRVGLTLSGWERYEAERRGLVAGSYGFMAMKFEDSILDPFFETVIKAAVRQIGFDLADMRDTAEAGLIDNLMRIRIRDSAFILADLTHDNLGAYWEAGYAEGLGKPILYICEKSKFDKAKTHFDTNHCTTVLWSVDDSPRFTANLVATLRRSLGLFS